MAAHTSQQCIKDNKIKCPGFSIFFQKVALQKGNKLMYAQAVVNWTLKHGIKKELSH